MNKIVNSVSLNCSLYHVNVITPPSLTRPQAGVLDFRRGGLKGNDQKKYTMEVKTVKPEKVTDWCKNGAKSATICHQTLIDPT